MNNEYLARARKIVPDAKTLIVLASKRAQQLDTGARPMIRTMNDDNALDTALLEIAEGKLQPSFEAAPQDDFLKEIEAVKAAAGVDLPKNKDT